MGRASRKPLLRRYYGNTALAMISGVSNGISGRERERESMCVCVCVKLTAF